MKSNIILNLLVNFLILYQINGLPLSKDAPYKRNKPDERDTLFEGDIRLPPSTSRGVFRRGNTIAWPNGIVPYEIAPGYELEQQEFIISAMRRMENTIAVNNVLCVNFRPRTSSDQDYITIRNADGCSSYVGQNPGMIGERTVSLEHPGCVSQGIIMHELLHTLGFYHEQSRPDRDNYVRIRSENILPGTENNFNKYENSAVDTKNTPYDYGSVMHYSKDAFSTVDGSPTIEPIEPGVEIGQRVWMSPLDIEEVRLFYNCSSNGIIPPTIPTKTASNYSSALTTNNGIYMRPGSETSNHYYEAIQIMVNRAGIYDIMSISDMDTLGFLYDGAFNPLNPSWNLLIKNDDDGGNSQFKLTAYLEAGVPYTLVVSTYHSSITGPFSVVATGPGNVQYIPMDQTVTTTTSTTTRPSIIYSNYSSALTTNDGIYMRPGSETSNYYYEAIQIMVNRAGTYDIMSLSDMDTFGFLYNGTFNPLNPSWNLLIKNDDDGGNSQFKLTAYLEAGVPYTLVVSTYYSNITGPFSVVATGLGNVQYIPMGQTVTTTTSTTTQPSIIYSNYSSALTTNDGIYMRPGSETSNHYYEAIQIMVNRAGTYDIMSLSDMDTFGFLYNGTFNPLNPSWNLLIKNDDDGGNSQFKLTAYLEAGVPYTLVVSTYYSNITGPFSVVATGPGNVQYIPMATRPSIIYSNYSNALTSNSETFSRQGNTGSVHYYHAIEVQVKTTGNYTFNSSSSFDSYGYLYQRSFNPSSPSLNLMASDDDSAGYPQFQLTGNLQSGIKYILVFTTYRERVTGAFNIIAYGPDDVSLKPISN